MSLLICFTQLTICFVAPPQLRDARAARTLPRVAPPRLDYYDADGKLVRTDASGPGERQRRIDEALAAADAKLDALAETDNMLRAKSMAELGSPPPAPDSAPELGGALAAAPNILGAIAVGLFLLNGVGVFGDGGDWLETKAASLTEKAESMGQVEYKSSRQIDYKPSF